MRPYALTPVAVPVGHHDRMEADQPERTPDGRYIVVKGRRWRATDPEIPEGVVAAALDAAGEPGRRTARPADG